MRGCLSLQSTTSKISTTQQRCLCPAHQDAREFHTSVYLTVGGLEHTGEVELGKQQRQCLQRCPPAVATEPTAPENPVAAGEAALSTPSCQPQWHSRPQVTGQQSQWGLGPCSSSCGGIHDSRAPPPQQ